MGAVAAFGDDDGFGQSVLRATAVGVEEELNEAESEFKDGGTVAQGALDGVPEAKVRVDGGEDADAEKPLSGRTALQPPGQDAEVQDRGQGVIEQMRPLVTDAGEFSAMFVVEDKPVRVDLDMDVRRQRVSSVCTPVVIDQGSRHRDEGKQDDDGQAIQHEGDRPAPEGSEFDAVELEQPRGLVGRELSHGESVAGGLLF